MDRLDAMRLFLRVVETGSFSEVAREQGVGQPAVSKQIAALEAHLGAQLLHRTSRSLNLTEAGQTYYEAAQRLVVDLDAVEQLVGSGALRPSGLLRVAVSAGFGRLQIMPLLPRFHVLYPDIVVELSVSDRFVDLIEEGIDVAVRIGQLADSALLARRIGTSTLATVAAPEYLGRAGVPETPAALAGHNCVAFTFQRSPRPWRYQGADGPISHAPQGSVRTNDAENIRAAVLAGIGLAQAPCWLFSAELQYGLVREVLGDFTQEPMPIHAVFPASRNPARKTRVFVDFLAAAFATDPQLKP
jgi:LysR family transcriptional regulator for bpeEF and oprC